MGETIPETNDQVNFTRCHLTYKTHLDLDEFKSWLLHFKPVKRMSFVHEIGDESEKDATPYEHTHVFLEWDYLDRMRVRSARWADFKGIHPNIKLVRSLQHAKHLALAYHKGHKVKPDDKKFFKEPVFLYQQGCEEWMLLADAFEVVQAAPDVISACLEVGVQPKSINDVMTIRKLGKKRKFTLPAEGVDPERFREVEWDRSKALVLRGPANTGKTQWALHQFHGKGFLVSDLDGLKRIPKGTEGIVVDELTFNNYDRSRQVHLVDMEMDREIHLRHVNAVLPRGLQRIFTCNTGEHPFNMEDPIKGPALKRRIVTLDIKTSLIE